MKVPLNNDHLSITVTLLGSQGCSLLLGLTLNLRFWATQCQQRPQCWSLLSGLTLLQNLSFVHLYVKKHLCFENQLLEIRFNRTFCTSFNINPSIRIYSLIVPRFSMHVGSSANNRSRILPRHSFLFQEWHVRLWVVNVDPVALSFVENPSIGLTPFNVFCWGFTLPFGMEKCHWLGWWNEFNSIFLSWPFLL